MKQVVKIIKAELIPNLTGTNFKFIARDFDDESELYWHLFTVQPKLDKDLEWLPCKLNSDKSDWQYLTWVNGLPEELIGLKSKGTLFEIEYPLKETCECGKPVISNCTKTPSGGWGSLKCGKPLCDDCKCDCDKVTCY